MPGCPNCGRDTARTEDWACRWCGYPLLSGVYKKLDKTYWQLQEENRRQPLEIEETGVTIQAEDIPPPVMTVETETEPEPESEQKPEPEPEEVVEIRAEPEPEPEEVEESKPEPELVAEIKPVAEIKAEPESEPEEAEGSKPELPADTEPGPEKPVAELAVDRLISDYAEDATAADARYSGRLLKISGVVSRVETNDAMDVHYIILVSTDQEQLQSIRCVFDKEYGPELSRLEKGQKATIQGIYEGSLIDFRMRDCAIIC